VTDGKEANHVDGQAPCGPESPAESARPRKRHDDGGRDGTDREGSHHPREADSEEETLIYTTRIDTWAETTWWRNLEAFMADDQETRDTIPPQNLDPDARQEQLAAIMRWYGRPALFFDTALVHGDIPRLAYVSGLSEREDRVNVHVFMHADYDLRMGSGWNPVETFQEVPVVRPGDELERAQGNWVLLFPEDDGGVRAEEAAVLSVARSRR
jgi:hypothetical protein